MTPSVVAPLGRKAYRVNDAMGINYGSERVRFPAPMLVDGHIRAVVGPVDYSSTPRDTRITSRFTINSDHGAGPCVADIVSLVETASDQPPGSSSFSRVDAVY